MDFQVNSPFWQMQEPSWITTLANRNPVLYDERKRGEVVLGDSFHFFHTLRVRYSEIDGQKIVFNAHYLTYLDVAITEYFRTVLGENWTNESSEGFDIALVKSTLEYRKPARLDDVLSIGCKIKKMGNSSFTVEFQITKKGSDDILLQAEHIYVSFNAETGKSAPIPQRVRSLINRFENR